MAFIVVTFATSSLATPLISDTASRVRRTSLGSDFFEGLLRVFEFLQMGTSIYDVHHDPLIAARYPQ